MKKFLFIYLCLISSLAFAACPFTKSVEVGGNWTAHVFDPGHDSAEGHVVAHLVNTDANHFAGSVYLKDGTCTQGDCRGLDYYLHVTYPISGECNENGTFKAVAFADPNHGASIPADWAFGYSFGGLMSNALEYSFNLDYNP